MRSVLSLLVLIALLVASRSEAEWEETEWGMSEKQVVKVLGEDAEIVWQGNATVVEENDLKLMSVRAGEGDHPCATSCLLTFFADRLSSLMVSMPGDVHESCSALLVEQSHLYGDSIVGLQEEVPRGERAFWIWRAEDDGGFVTLFFRPTASDFESDPVCELAFHAPSSAMVFPLNKLGEAEQIWLLMFEFEHR